MNGLWSRLCNESITRNERSATTTTTAEPTRDQPPMDRSQWNGYWITRGTTSSTASNGPCTLGYDTETGTESMQLLVIPQDIRMGSLYYYKRPQCPWSSRREEGGGGEATVTTSVISKTSHWPIIKTRDRLKRRKRRGPAWPFITMFGHNLSQIGFE